MADRIELGPQGFLYPMPMTLVRAVLLDGPNFMPIAWVNRVQFNPPRLACGLGKVHATNAAIREHDEFSVHIPSVDMVALTDWCGLVLGEPVAWTRPARSRSSAAPSPTRDDRRVPAVPRCRVFNCGPRESRALRRRYRSDVDRGALLGRERQARHREGAAVHADDARPRYWAVGEQIGDAWSIGRGYEPAAGG